MGIFDALFSGIDNRTQLSPQESFAGILLAASACDGHISSDEFNHLLTALFRMKLFQRVNEKQFNSVMNKLMSILKKHDAETLVNGCISTLPEQLKLAAFTNACNIVLADGVLEDDERQFIADLSTKLGLDPQTAQAIGTVMIIKNQG